MPVASVRLEGDDKPSFKCDVCGKSYSRSEYLRRHERKHQDSKPFPCTECTKSFARSDVLLRHRRKCHPDAPENAGGSAAGPSKSNANYRRSPPGNESSKSPSPPVVSVSASTAGGPSRSNGAGAAGGRDARRDAAAPYISQLHHLSVPSTSRGGPTPPPLTQQQFLDQHQLMFPTVDPNTTYLEQFTLQHQQQQSGVASRSSSSSSNPSTSYPNQHQQQQQYLSPSLNDTSYYPPPPMNTDPLSLLANSVPAYQQQQYLPQPSQQDLQDPAHLSHLSQYAQPETARNPYFPPTDGPSSSGLPPASHFVLSPTVINPNPAFLAPERAVPNEWYPMFSPSILSPLGLFSSNRTPSLLNNGTTTASDQAGSYFPMSTQKPWAPSPGSFFDSLGTGLSPSHPDAGFLFDGMSELDALGSEDEEVAAVDAVTVMDVEKQTRDNTLAAEKVILGAEWANRFGKSGMQNYDVPESDPFWISGDRFLGCYSVEHWQIPPICTLTKVARRTLTQLAPHLPMIHAPTFVLREAPGCLAFSMCTVGGPRRGGGRWSSAHCGNATLQGVITENDVVAKRPVQNALFELESSEEDGWDQIKSVVKREKTDMLIKSFIRSRGVLFTEYNVGLLQALLLYNAPAFLSDSQEQRMSAQLLLGTIVNIARQVGIFDPTNDHVAPDTDTCKSGFTFEERTLSSIWKRWARWEGIRRTAYVVFILDTVGCLESSTALNISPAELSSFPLPASEPIWEAPTAEAWSAIVTATGHSYSMGDMMTKLTTPMLSQQENDCLLGGRTLLGPFGWLVLVMVLVREVLDFGEGKVRDSTVRWLPGVPQEMVGQQLQTALMRWRRGWDYDDQCRRVEPPAVYSDETVECAFQIMSSSIGSDSEATSSPENSSRSSGSTGTGSGSTGGTSRSGSGSSTDSAKKRKARLPYSDELFCREALPYWWFAKILLDTILNPAPTQTSVPAPFGNGQTTVGGFKAGVNQFKEKNIMYREVLNSARVFSRAGEGRAFV